MRPIDANKLIELNDEEPIVWADDDDYTLGRKDEWNKWVDSIDYCETIDVDRKSGHWIENQTLIKCSVCGYKKYLVGLSTPNYCENCGATMDLKE